MLNNICKCIDSMTILPPFDDYFLSYTFDVQDRNIERELHNLIKYNQVGLTAYQQLIYNTLERVMKS
jgi:hypothetical protein